MLMVLVAPMTTNVKMVTITAMKTLDAQTLTDLLSVPVMVVSQGQVPSVKMTMSVIILMPVQPMPLVPTLMADLNALAKMVSAEVSPVKTLTNVLLERTTATPMPSVPILLVHSNVTVLMVSKEPVKAALT